MRSLNRSREDGSVLPIILAVGIGVGALTAGYTMRQLRESAKSEAYAHREAALFEALGQLEVVSHLINSSGYDAGGRNLAIQQALARGDDQFIDLDGWETGVTAMQFGAPVPGLGATYRIISEAERGDQTRRVMALVRERQSFADFNYFVDAHPLGISGGGSPVFPWIDAPEGAIHSNQNIQFYFADKHFRDAVTAVTGFDYVSGAVGPAETDPQNTFFHGPSNDAAAPIGGLLDVDVGGFATRADTMLALSGEWDYAHVKLLGDQIHLEHWEAAHYENQGVSTWTPVSHMETVTHEVPEVVIETHTWTTTENVYEEQPIWIEETSPIIESHQETHTHMVWRDVWVEGGGGGDTGGSGSGSGVGYWESQLVEEEYTVWVDEVVGWEDTSHWDTHWVATGDTYEETHTEDVEVETGNMVTVTEEVEVIDEWIETVSDESVWVDERKVNDHVLGTHGTVFVSGDIVFDPMRSSHDGLDTHVLDGQVTFASGGDIHIADSIVYGHMAGGSSGGGDDDDDDDEGGGGSATLETAYLNGDSHTAEYTPNPDYTGDSVLGLIALSDIEYTEWMPDHSEINATLLAKTGHVRVNDTAVDSDGSVYTTGSGFRKMGFRRLGGVVSYHRPVSTYIDSSNAVTHGFIFAKSVFDRSQLRRPPIGFPTMARPVEIARILREVL